MSETKSKIFKIKTLLFLAGLGLLAAALWLLWLRIVALPATTLAAWALIATFAAVPVGMLGFALGRMEARGFIQGQRARAPKVAPDPAAVLAGLAEEQFPGPVIERQEERRGFTEV